MTRSPFAMARVAAPPPIEPSRSSAPDRTAGQYLRDARIGAGVALEDVTACMRLIHRPDLAADFALLLGMIETDLSIASAEHLMALRIAFPFRPCLYRQLCAEASTPQPETPDHA